MLSLIVLEVLSFKAVTLPWLAGKRVANNGLSANIFCNLCFLSLLLAATAGRGGSKAPWARAPNISTSERGQAPQPGPDHLRWKPGEWNTVSERGSEGAESSAVFHNGSACFMFIYRLWCMEKAVSKSRACPSAPQASEQSTSLA